MADPVLKSPAGQPVAAAPRKPFRDWLRRRRRPLLLVVLPIVAVIGGLAFYLMGGRYVTTDDAYVGAQKVLLTPDVSGKIVDVEVKEGQRVKAGDVLFRIDPVPFELALRQSEAALATARTDYETTRSNLDTYDQMIALADEATRLRQRDVERKDALVKSSFGSQLDLDNARATFVTARTQLEFLRQQRDSALNRMLGDAKLPLEKYPAYAQALARRDDAQRNVDLSTLRAPIDGTAAQVDNIQLGRFVSAGTPVFSIIDTARPWVDANPKESDFTYVRAGQPVTVTVDAFPDHVFSATIGSLSPGTGAQFAILPPQNATGNFVKVVQRVPVRIYFDENDKLVRRLKAGMSTYVSIDTGHTRSLAGLLGLSSAVAHPRDDDE